MKSVKISISIFILTIILVVSGFFLLGIERTSINYWTLAVVVFSITISLCVTLMTFRNKGITKGLFYLSGINSITWIYQIAVILGIVITRLLSCTIGVFVFVQLLINVVFFMALLFILHTAEHIDNVNNDTMDKLENGEYNTPKRGGF